MSEDTTRVSDPAELGNAEVPRFLIDAGRRLQDRGLHRIQPPSSLVEATLTACEHALRDLGSSVEEKTGDDRVHEWFRELLAVRPLPAPEFAFARAAALSLVEEGVAFALKYRGSPPAYAVEDHCVTEPDWWSEHEFLSTWRMACDLADRRLVNLGGTPLRRVVILRSRVEDYNERQIEAIRLALETGTSDTYWLPHNAVAGLHNRDFALVARSKLFEIKRGAGPEFVVAQDISICREAIRMCDELDRLAQSGFARRIRAAGRLAPEAINAVESGDTGIRELLAKTIMGLP
ncbi:MAG: hypothetical protein AB1714_13980 [Acidobacteriota bacterium]